MYQDIFLNATKNNRTENAYENNAQKSYSKPGIDNNIMKSIYWTKDYLFQESPWLVATA